MFKIRLAAAAAIAGAATLLTAGTAQASNYPDPNITVTVSDAILVGGNTFSYTASSGKVDCDWTVTYSAGRAPGTDANQTGSGTSLSGTFDTKVVDSTFKSPIKALCRYDDKAAPIVAKVVTSNTVTPAFYSAAPSSALQAAIQSASASATITLLPKGGLGDDEDKNGVLPDTGGSNLWILALGGALVAGGAGVTYAARRRHSAR